MKKYVIFILSITTLLGGAMIKDIEVSASNVSLTGQETSDVVNIPDLNLKRVINDYYLGQPEDYNPTIEDLESIYVLDLPEENITSLEGLQYAKNLTHLNLSNGDDTWDTNPENYNHVTDLTPISELYQLNFLNVSGNKITDISLLKNLKNLDNIHLSRNKISDISALEELSQLTILFLDETEVKDIDVLKNLPLLRTLSLSYTKVNNLAPLSYLNQLVYLELNGIGMTSLDSISHLSNNLYHLYIADNKLASLEGIDKFTNLSTLDISNNKGIQNVELVGSLENLYTFYADNVGLSNVKFLNSLDRLDRLSVKGNHIRDLDDIMGAGYVNGKDQTIVLDPIEVKRGDTVSIDNPLSGDYWSEGDLFVDEPITVKNGRHDGSKNVIIWDNVEDEVLEFEFCQAFGNIRNLSYYTGKVTVPVKFIEEAEQQKVGWVEENNNWYYYKENGAMATGWEQESGTWYYFNPLGEMQTGWLKEGNTWYYLKSGGAMATGWEQVSGIWYYFNPSGKMQTGWLKEGNTWYYLKSSGAMVTGWEKVSGTWYYFNPSGEMQTGWLKEGNTWYYLKSSGAMAVGWEQVGGTWYYFNPSGKMQTGWLKEGNTWYYLKLSGAMATGWEQVGGVWYYFNLSGKMATNTVIDGWKITSSGAAYKL